jgi:hypothetical protein
VGFAHYGSRRFDNLHQQIGDECSKQNELHEIAFSGSLLRQQFGAKLCFAPLENLLRPSFVKVLESKRLPQETKFPKDKCNPSLGIRQQDCTKSANPQSFVNYF